MRGGKRNGAGRKAGSQTKRTQEIIAQASANGITPLEFMLSVLQDASKPFDQRYSAARDAAPYMHPRLASSTVKINDKRSVADLDTAELIASLQQEGHAEGASSPEARDGESDPVH